MLGLLLIDINYRQIHKLIYEVFNEFYELRRLKTTIKFNTNTNSKQKYQPFLPGYSAQNWFVSVWLSNEFVIMIHLLLVDDQELVCQGLRAMLNLESDIEVVGVANNGQVAIQQVEALQPDVVLMDVRMPVMDGREATRIICQRFPNVKVLIVSTFDEDEYIAHSIKAGAKGYLLKDMPVEELVRAIRLIDRGYTQMGPGLMERMLDGMIDIKSDKETEVALVELTPREIEVLNLIGIGCTNREIARQLYIAEATVKSHVTHILNRLNLRNRSQIAIYANSVKQAYLN